MPFDTFYDTEVGRIAAFGNPLDFTEFLFIVQRESNEYRAVPDFAVRHRQEFIYDHTYVIEAFNKTPTPSLPSKSATVSAPFTSTRTFFIFKSSGLNEEIT